MCAAPRACNLRFPPPSSPFPVFFSFSRSLPTSPSLSFSLPLPCFSSFCRTEFGGGWDGHRMKTSSLLLSLPLPFPPVLFLRGPLLKEIIDHPRMRPHSEGSFVESFGIHEIGEPAIAQLTVNHDPTFWIRFTESQITHSFLVSLLVDPSNKMHYV